MSLSYKIIKGNSLKVLQDIQDNTADSVVTDPPYGISFMNNKWDYDVPSVVIWKECLRILKPGGHLLSFASTRTQHKIATDIETAGFEIRDMIVWVYGTGFPKSKLSLKPALEPITVARKPLAENTIKDNVSRYGTGGLNIEDSRVGTEVMEAFVGKAKSNGKYSDRKWDVPERIGRFPSNFIHDGSKVAADGLGHASKFFYCAKASKEERNIGADNNHPTVKPLILMEYLINLVTPEGGLVVDPFMGSGTTGVACVNTNRNFIGVERDDEYFDTASERLEYYKRLKNNK